MIILNSSFSCYEKSHTDSVMVDRNMMIRRLRGKDCYAHFFNTFFLNVCTKKTSKIEIYGIIFHKFYFS